MKLKNLRFRIKDLRLWRMAVGDWRLANSLWLTAYCLLLTALSSCYSFTGSSLSPETKTIQINPFINNSPLNNPTLAQQFTIDLQNRFLQRTTLKGTKENPSILLEGEITGYTISPTTVTSPTESVGGVLQSAQNKLTVSVKVHYENRVEPEKSFDRTFTDEVVFSNILSTIDIENTQVRLVNERIINKIFNDIVANW